ncbi:RING-type domain-containing protein [Abeliophyllum distichum]|uniref:RING-type domain-containing protein n=1 Tax=Abeliophyllum distichum TaxID=126358 RepID=A0ABD1R869_9LAMI
MECGNPPASTDSVGERKELALTSRPSGLTPGGAYSSRPGLISFPQVSLPYAHFPRDDMGGTCQSYPPENVTEKNMIDDLMNPNGLANPQTDASLRNVGNNVSNFPRVSQTSHSKMSTRESCQSIDGSNMVPAHCLMDGGVVSAEYQDSEVHMNYMPARGDASSGYSVNTQGREARTSTRKLGEALSFRHNSRVRETLRSSSSLAPIGW